MQRLEVSCAVRPIYGSLGAKGLSRSRWQYCQGCVRPLARWDCGFEYRPVHVSCECCVLSGRGLCFGLIPRPEESYRACVYH
jgi:hypothetical protein